MGIAVGPRPSGQHQRLVRAAGAVVWRPLDSANLKPGASLRAEDLEVLVVHRPRYHDWSWPKGKAELNEPIISAAVREVEEEAQLPVTLGLPMTRQRYRLGSGQIKEVYYWSGSQLLEGPALGVRPVVVPAPTREIDSSQWHHPVRARQLLTRRGDRRLLDELVLMGEAGQLSAQTIVLLRNAKSSHEGSWPGSSRDRPLSRLGTMQAVDVIPQLSAFGIEKVITTPWRRGMQTVMPYVSLSGAQMRVENALAADVVATDRTGAQRLAEELVRDGGAPTALCANNVAISALLDVFIGEHGRHRFAQVFQPKATLGTAEMFVIHLVRGAGASVTSIERHATFTKVAMR